MTTISASRKSDCQGVGAHEKGLRRGISRLVPRLVPNSWRNPVATELQNANTVPEA